MSLIHVPFSYDKLVIAVGSTSSTHGVPGLEHCFQLKTIADAQSIRRRIMGSSVTTLVRAHQPKRTLDNFEVASLPTTTPEERKRLLSFVVCGGGPTGVETAAVRLTPPRRLDRPSYPVPGNLRLLSGRYHEICRSFDFVTQHSHRRLFPVP